MLAITILIATITINEIIFLVISNYYWFKDYEYYYYGYIITIYYY